MSDETSDGGGSPIRRLYAAVGSRYAFKIGAVVLVAAVVLSGAGYYTFIDVRASVESDVDSNLLNAAEQEAQELDAFVSEWENRVVQLSAKDAVVAGQRNEVRAELQATQEFLPGFVEAIHYYNAETGEVVASTHLPTEGRQLDESDRPWAVDGDTFEKSGESRSFGPYEFDGTKRIGFASPVLFDSEHVVVISVNLAERGRMLDAPIAGGNTEVVSTRTGDVTVSAESDRIREGYFLASELPHLDGEVSGARIDRVDNPDREVIDDTDVAIATAPMDEKPWVVVTAAPEGAAYGTVGDVSRSVLLLIAVSIFGFVALGAIVSRDVSRSLDRMRTYAEEIESGSLDVEIDASRSDEFGEVAALFGRIRDTLRSQLSEIEQQADEAERAKADAEALSEHLEAKATEYLASIEAAADGDLTRRLDPESENEAMAEIGRALNGMLEDVETVVSEIQTVAEEVDEASTEVTASTDEISSTSADVAESVEEISAGTEAQNEKLDAATAEMGELSATVEEIASSSNAAATQSERAAELGRNGRWMADDVVDEMDRLERAASETAEEMGTLQTDVERIGEIVELIDDIAEQTNILALNASIEAARADEAGEGFAVVADEVKGLAEETADATREIEELIGAVQASTDSVAEDMFGMSEDVQSGREAVEETAETLEAIATEITDANEGIQSIHEATDEQADSTQEVVAAVEDVAGVSEQTAEEAQTVSAAAEEQTSAIEQVSNSADSLSERADDLRSLVDRFETDARDAEAGAVGGTRSAAADDD